MDKPQVCAGCGVRWKDGTGFIGEHDMGCVNARYGWNFTLDAKDKYPDIYKMWEDSDLYKCFNDDAEPMSKQDIQRRRLEAIHMWVGVDASMYRDGPVTKEVPL